MMEFNHSIRKESDVILKEIIRLVVKYDVVLYVYVRIYSMNIITIIIRP